MEPAPGGDCPSEESKAVIQLFAEEQVVERRSGSLPMDISVPGPGVSACK